MGAACSSPHPLKRRHPAAVSPSPLPAAPRRPPDPAVEALLARGVAVPTAQEITDGTLANAVGTDAPSRVRGAPPPFSALQQASSTEITGGELAEGEGSSSAPAPASSSNRRHSMGSPLLPGIEEAPSGGGGGGAMDTLVSRASAQPTVHASEGEPRSGGSGELAAAAEEEEAAAEEAARTGSRGQPAAAAAGPSGSEGSPVDSRVGGHSSDTA